MLTIAREEDKIPWEWIVDETREPECIPAWNNMADYGEAVLRFDIGKDFWSMQSERLEVSVRKRDRPGNVSAPFSTNSQSRSA